MYRTRKASAIIITVLIAISTSGITSAARSAELEQHEKIPTADGSKGEIQSVQAKFDILKQAISQVENYSQLERPLSQVRELSVEIERLTTSLIPEQAQLDTSLAVLGVAPAGNEVIEKSEIAQRRSSLHERKKILDSSLELLTSLRQQTASLTVQMDDIRRNLFEAEVTLSTKSILAPGYWSPLLSPTPEDQYRLVEFSHQVVKAVTAAIVNGAWMKFSTLALVALLIWTPGRNIIERISFKLCVRVLPDGHLRRSSLALATVIISLVTTAAAVHLLARALALTPTSAPLFTELSSDFMKEAYTCVLIYSLGRALLSTQRPSWRLLKISNPLALALEPYPGIFACTLLLLTTIQNASTSFMSSDVVLAGRGVIALTITILLLILLRQVRLARRKKDGIEQRPNMISTLAGTIHVAAYLATFTSLVSLLFGYVSFARLLTYELVWAYIVFSGFYLLIQFYKDICHHIFFSNNPNGNAFKQTTGMSDKRIEQLHVVVSGIGRATLYLLGAISLFVGGIGVTIGQLITRIISILGGAGLRQLNIVPGHLFNATAALLVGVVLVRSLRRWLDLELLPKTDMAPGMGASLSTLFGNIGYFFVLLFSMAALGIRWTNLAWIVSALSVGIGFGLQEIVKNFVSGLILLTERPVKVGDLISISGVEGDVRRINVRATEIQLSDRSIVIVPNSQLISQSVRNITVGGNAQGVVSLELLMPLDINPDEVESLLYQTFCDHSAVLDAPPPYVRFSKLSPDGVILVVTGCVASPRIVGITKSELLHEILKRLSTAGIRLAKPITAA